MNGRSDDCRPDVFTQSAVVVTGVFGSAQAAAHSSEEVKATRAAEEEDGEGYGGKRKVRTNARLLIMHRLTCLGG